MTIIHPIDEAYLRPVLRAVLAVLLIRGAVTTTGVTGVTGVTTRGVDGLEIIPERAVGTVTTPEVAATPVVTAAVETLPVRTTLPVALTGVGGTTGTTSGGFPVMKPEVATKPVVWTPVVTTPVVLGTGGRGACLHEQ